MKYSTLKKSEICGEDVGENVLGTERIMKLNEILNIRYPFIQGGMANIATGEFAAVVSNAGGLGCFSDTQNDN